LIAWASVLHLPDASQRRKPAPTDLEDLQVPAIGEQAQGGNLDRPPIHDIDGLLQRYGIIGGGFGHGFPAPPTAWRETK
jgi:hypothetical protein